MDCSADFMSPQLRRIKLLLSSSGMHYHQNYSFDLDRNNIYPKVRPNRHRVAFIALSYISHLISRKATDRKYLLMILHHFSHLHASQQASPLIATSFYLLAYQSLKTKKNIRRKNQIVDDKRVMLAAITAKKFQNCHISL